MSDDKWREARRAFEAGEAGVRALARRLGVSPSTVHRHVEAEGWRRPDVVALSTGEDPPATSRGRHPASIPQGASRAPRATVNHEEVARPSRAPGGPVRRRSEPDDAVPPLERWLAARARLADFDAEHERQLAREVDEEVRELAERRARPFDAVGAIYRGDVPW